MEHHKLNSIDLRILSELQANGRITNVELSRRAKITAPPCLRRMRALEKAGYIKGYHADLDPKLLGFEVTGYVFVGLSSQADADLRKFEEQTRGWPEVRECYMLSGEVDFLLKCVAKDLSSFQSFITDTLTASKNVAGVKSSLVIHSSKNDPGVFPAAGYWQVALNRCFFRLSSSWNIPYPFDQGLFHPFHPAG